MPALRDVTHGELHPDTVKFIYEATKDGPVEQMKDADSLNTKVVQIFTAGGIMIGLGGFSGGIPDAYRSTTVLLVLGLGLFFVAAAATFTCLRNRQFLRSLHADELWPNYYDLNVDEIRHSLVADIATAYAHNRPLLLAKARLVQIAVGAVTLEAVCVTTAIIISKLP